MILHALALTAVVLVADPPPPLSNDEVRQRMEESRTNRLAQCNAIEDKFARDACLRVNRRQ